mgnify:CR=1 FL=1
MKEGYDGCGVRYAVGFKHQARANLRHPGRQGRHLFLHRGPRNEIALQQQRLVTHQGCELGGSFDAFRRDLQSQVPAQVDGGRGDGAAEPRVANGTTPQERSGSGNPSASPRVSSRKPSSEVASAPVKQAAAPAASFDATSLINKAVAGLSNKATRGFMTDETLTLLRSECPGWDLYNLHAEFERWVNADSSRTPANWQKAFIGYVRRWHENHRHELRGR